MSIEIPAKSFYSGSTKKEYFYFLSKRRKRLKLEDEFKKRPLPSMQHYDHCFSERKVRKWFMRQQEAIDFCDMKNEKCLCIFAFEKADGKRSYLVTTRRQFWDNYKATSPGQRHFYEVIRQGEPCRLYFDIEFQYEFNPCLDGKAVLEIFINYMCYCIYKNFGIICTEKHVIDLASSTSSKFSRHLIFNHPDLLFPDNIICGVFVKDCCRRLKDYAIDGKTDDFLPFDDSEINMDFFKSHMLSKDKLKMVLIKTDKGESFLCDLCVYTKNRNFRLFLSSKVSKHVPLEIAKNNKFEFKMKPSRKDKYFKYQMRNIRFDADYEKFSDTLVCPGEDFSGKILSFGSENKENFRPHCSEPNKPKEICIETGVQRSSFPELDKFVIGIVNRNGPPGHIRRWMYYERSQMMIYDIGNNRWCGNIQRQHKGNHVYYVADLKFGYVYQKCHDFECSQYRSTEIALPNKTNPLFTANEIIKEFDETIDEELMQLFESDIEICDDALSQQTNDASTEYHRKHENTLHQGDHDDTMEDEFFTEEYDNLDEALLKLSGYNIEEKERSASNVSDFNMLRISQHLEDDIIDEEILKLSVDSSSHNKLSGGNPEHVNMLCNNSIDNNEQSKISPFDALKFSQEGSITHSNQVGSTPCLFLQCDTDEEELEGMLNISDESLTSIKSPINDKSTDEMAETSIQKTTSPLDNAKVSNIDLSRTKQPDLHKISSLCNSTEDIFGDSQFKDTRPISQNGSYCYSQTKRVDDELNELFSEDISISDV